MSLFTLSLLNPIFFSLLFSFLFSLLLLSSPEERARRRLLELQEKGDGSETFESVLRDIRERDHNDSTRSYMPLRIADDAVVVDTTGMTREEVLDFMEARIQR